MTLRTKSKLDVTLVVKWSIRSNSTKTDQTPREGGGVNLQTFGFFLEPFSN